MLNFSRPLQFATSQPRHPRRWQTTAAIALTAMAAMLVAATGHQALAQTDGDQADQSADQEYWYVMLLDGQRVGHARITRTTDKQGQIISAQQTKIAIRRGPITLRIEQAGSFVETSDHKPIKATSSMTLGNVAVVQEMTFHDDHRLLITSQGEQKRQQKLPVIDGDWYTPAALNDYITRKLEAGANKLSIRTLDLAMGPDPTGMQLAIAGREKIELFGRTVEAVVWDAQIDKLPGVVMREYVDDHGVSLKASVNLGPGMNIEMLQADKALALAEVDPPEIMANTLIAVAKPITNPRESTLGMYDLTWPTTGQGNGDKPKQVTLPRAGYQRVVYGHAGKARVIVDLSNPVNPQTDLPTDANLAATAMADHASAAVTKLVANAKAQAPDPGFDAMSKPEQAEHLRQFVHGFVNEKNLSVGYASATEVAKTGEGDCTEHGVLLAAMLRHVGIPSRTVSGLVYVDGFLGKRNVFGYHLWTQAWLTPQATDMQDDNGDAPGGRWVDLDATLDKNRPFDATHIALATSDLADTGLTNDMVALLPLIGRLQVVPISVE